MIEGTATVSADGLSVSTDPGTGITHPGWHGLTPPGGPAGPNGPPPPAAIPNGSTPVIHDPVALPLIAQETGGLLAHDNLKWSPPASGSLTVKIEVDGPLGEFMKRTGNLSLDSQTFTLTPNSVGVKTLGATSQDYTELLGKDGFASIEGDRLYGAKIQVTETTVKPDGKVGKIDVRTFYLYRWISAVLRSTPSLAKGPRRRSKRRSTTAR